MEKLEICKNCLNNEIREILKKCNKCLVKNPINIDKLVKTILNIFFKLSKE